jgi:hypothetical protein
MADMCEHRNIRFARGIYLRQRSTVKVSGHNILCTVGGMNGKRMLQAISMKMSRVKTGDLHQRPHERRPDFLETW